MGLLAIEVLPPPPPPPLPPPPPPLELKPDEVPVDWRKEEGGVEV